MKTRIAILFIALTSMAFAQYAPSGQTPFGGNLNQTYPTNQQQPILNSTSVNSSSQQISPAQQGPVPAGQHVCATHEINEAYWQSEGLLQQFNSSYYQGIANMNPSSLDKTPGVNTIAVIFHVVHNPNNPAENVSNALIMQVYNDLVEDFQKLNADTINARTGFGFIPADPNINFCLATQDPLGNPLTEIGVIRVSTSEDWYDSNNGEENKMKSSATGGSDIWDRNDYLNVWICDISNGAGSGTAGYAYRPTPTMLPNPAIDGIVLDYNLGMNNDNVLTHEVGHYLGLDHTWGGSGGCGADDGFGDTPITDGPSFNYAGSCSGNQQTCPGTETQYENYMDYANCTCMYTQNQADFMLSILQGIRNSLLISPGCDPTNTPPNSAFASIPLGPAPVIIPINGSVDFYDQSTNVPTSWAWVISGIQGTDWNYINGTSATSENPQVEFYTVGFYDVTLTASNAFGSDPTPAFEANYVQVVAPAAGTACDTLRNYNPADPFYNLTATPAPGYNGHIPGNALLNNEDVLQWAEFYTATATTEVRRLEFAPGVVVDNGGSIVFKVFDDNGPGGDPGTVLATDTVPLADLNALQWNQIDFDTPASVTGTFWVGYELSYAAGDTFALLCTYGTPPVNYLFGDYATSGWTDVGTVFGTTFAAVIDVLTSNGPAPSANFTATDASVCEGGEIDVNGSNSTNVTDYFWYQTDDPFTTVLNTANTPSTTFAFPTQGSYAIYLFGDGSCMTDGVYLPVTVNPPITATVTVTNTTCGNNNGVISVTGVAGGDSTHYFSLDGQNYYTDSTFNNLPAGTYDVYIATIGDNCETMYTVTINPSTPFVATVSPNQSVCPGGSATITASGGVSYQWFDGITPIGSTPSVTVTPANTTQYNCIVTDGVGCQSTVTTTVAVNPLPAAPVITPSGSTTFCAGNSIDLTSDYGSGNVWSTTETTQTITVNSSGSYSVTYTDGNGCSSTSAPVVVTVNALPTAPVITPGGATTFCAGGSVNLTSDYGSNNVWSTTETTQTITVNSTGSYSVTYTDGNGCSATSSPVNVTVNPLPSAPTITPSGATTFCAGGSVTLTSSQPVGNNWSTGSTSTSINVTTTGSYTVTYTDGNGCSATSAPTNVTVNPAPTIASGTVTDPTACATATGSIEITGSGTGVVSWTGPSSGNSGSTTLPYTITNLAAGSYNVTYVDGSSGCTSNTVIEALTDPSAPAAPTITPSGATTFCAGGSVDLTSSYGTGNTWSTTETSQTINVTSTGTYTVTYTDGFGCSSTSAPISVTVNANPSAPTVTPGGATTFCAGGSVTLTSSEGTGNVWSTAETTQTIMVNSTGSYSVTYTDGNGCSATSSPVSVTVNANPAAPTITPSGATTFCNGGSVNLTSDYGSGNVWSTTETTQTITVNSSGTYSVTYTDGNGCSATSSTTTVTVNPLPTVNAGADQTICDGSSVTLSGSGAQTYSWDNGVTDGVAFTPAVGTVTYTVTGTDANGCSNTDQVDVIVNALPNVNAGPDQTVCEGTIVTLSGSGASTYAWDNGVTDGVGFTPTVGTVTYTVTGTDANGCINSDMVDVTVNATPTVNGGPDQSVCDGDQVTLAGSGAQTYVWDNGVTDGVAFTPAVGTVTYTVTGTDANGCSNTDQVDITVNALPNVTLAALDTTCEYYSAFSLTGGSPAGGTYSGTGVSGGQFDPATGLGSYTITYSYTDGNGCSNTAQQNIVVDECLGIDEEVISGLNIYPNPVSDVLAIELDGDFEVTIHDARGRLIAEFNGQNTLNIETADYEIGVYMLQVTTDDKTILRRIVKQ